MICFQISIFEPLETTTGKLCWTNAQLWFAFKLVSLNHWKQQIMSWENQPYVVICFQISIFEPLETTLLRRPFIIITLWFAFKLVSLNHWKQPCKLGIPAAEVVICFQISIFEPLETTYGLVTVTNHMLWFAFKLVSLNHWKQQTNNNNLVDFCCDLLSN